MAKINNTLTFKAAEISLEDNTITELTKEEEIVHTLSDVINQFKGKLVDITFKESKDVVYNEEE